MFYISQNKEELVAYNETVNAGKNYTGFTNNWAEVMSHPNGVDFAIVKHKDYTAEFEELDLLPSDWWPDPEE